MCSFCTACNSSGSIPSARKMVGATCWFEVAVDTDAASMSSKDTRRAVCTSSSLNPPCSESLCPPVKIMPVLVLRMMSGVHGSTVGSLNLLRSAAPEKTS